MDSAPFIMFLYSTKDVFDEECAANSVSAIPAFSNHWTCQLKEYFGTIDSLLAQSISLSTRIPRALTSYTYE